MPGRMGCSISPRRALVRVCSPVSTRTVYSHIANAAQSAQPRAPLASRNAVTGLPVALARGPSSFTFELVAVGDATHNAGASCIGGAGGGGAHKASHAQQADAPH